MPKQFFDSPLSLGANRSVLVVGPAAALSISFELIGKCAGIEAVAGCGKFQVVISPPPRQLLPGINLTTDAVQAECCIKCRRVSIEVIPQAFGQVPHVIQGRHVAASNSGADAFKIRYGREAAQLAEHHEMGPRYRP